MQSINSLSPKTYDPVNVAKGIAGESQVRDWLTQAFPKIALLEHRLWENGVDIVGYVPELNLYIIVEVLNWKNGNYPSRDRLMSIVRNLSDYPIPQGSRVIKSLVCFGATPTSQSTKYLASCGIAVIRMSVPPRDPRLRNPFNIKRIDEAVVSTLTKDNNEYLLNSILHSGAPGERKIGCEWMLHHILQFYLAQVLSGHSARSNGSKLQTVQPPRAKDTCPYCGSPGRKCPFCNGWMICHGHFNGKQRFRCKACHRTVSEVVE